MLEEILPGGAYLHILQISIIFTPSKMDIDE